MPWKNGCPSGWHERCRLETLYRNARCEEGFHCRLPWTVQNAQKWRYFLWYHHGSPRDLWLLLCSETEWEVGASGRYHSAPFRLSWWLQSNPKHWIVSMHWRQNLLCHITSCTEANYKLCIDNPIISNKLFCLLRPYEMQHWMIPPRCFTYFWCRLLL